MSTIPTALPRPVPHVYGPPKPAPLEPTDDYAEVQRRAAAAHDETTTAWVSGPGVHPKVRDSIYAGFPAHPQQSVKVPKVGESTTTPDGKTMSEAEKAAWVGNDFASWGRNVLGSDAKTRAHFEGIKPVKDGYDMLLANGARQRYQAAMHDFESAPENKGLTLTDSGSSGEMRDRQQSREAVGKLGHPLGFAFDIQAANNPNLKKRDGDKYDLTTYMLEKFGGDPSEHGGRGRATMDRKSERGEKQSLESRVEEMGKHATLTGEDQATLSQIRSEYTEMRDTSDRFTKSLPSSNVDMLKETQQLYFQYRQDSDRFAKEPDNSELSDTLASTKAAISRRISDGILPWTSRLHMENDTAEATIQSKSAEIEDLSSSRDATRTMDDSTLDTFAASNGYGSRAAYASARKLKPKKGAAKIPGSYEDYIRGQIGDKIRADETSINEQRDIENVNRELEQKLIDPARMFGGAKQKDGSYADRAEVANVPTFQLITEGFCNDFAASKLDGDGKQQVHNVDTVAALARRGFSPGATFGDTMHFDLYSRL